MGVALTSALVLGLFSRVSAARSVGDGDGEYVKHGVGGWDGARAVHVREHMVHVGEEHLEDEVSNRQPLRVEWQQPTERK